MESENQILVKVKGIFLPFLLIGNYMPRVTIETLEQGEKFVQS